MIPKAQILQAANNFELQATTVQKDYVLGWLLRAIAGHSEWSKWVFKGGTCLKKCYFETYRFSEDLDFTVPQDRKIDINKIQAGLEQITAEIESRSGLTFPRSDWKIERYKNKRGKISYQIKIPFDGPLKLPPKSLQRIKLDITQDELIAEQAVERDLHHNYSDRLPEAPRLLCYSINEILAEKARAIVERNGRARDVYDIVNISRNFREEIDAIRTIELTKAKFEFKELNPPTVEYIINSIDWGVLKANWDHQLAHQINSLPPIESYIADFKNAIAWWLTPEQAAPALVTIPEAEGTRIARQFYSLISAEIAPSALDYIRRAARNRFLVLVEYMGAQRLVEPYALRHPARGDEILHVWEVSKNGFTSNMQKRFITNRIAYLSTSNKTFTPKWEVEL